MKCGKFLLIMVMVTAMLSMVGCSEDDSSEDVVRTTTSAKISTDAETAVTTTFKMELEEETTIETDDEEIIYDYDSAFSEKVDFDYNSYLSDEYESDFTDNTEIQNDDSSYAFYELLSEAWDGKYECREVNDIKIYFDDNKIYFINTNPDGDFTSSDGYTWGFYNIDTKEYTTTYNAAEPLFETESGVYVSIYDSWYYDNYFYAVYRCTSYEVHNYYQYHCAVKMDKNGNVVKRIMFDEEVSIGGIVDGSLIITYHDKDDYESTFYYVYSSDLELLASFTRPSVPLSHGLSEPAYVSDFFGYDGNIYAVANKRFYMMNIADSEWIEINIIEAPTAGFGKYCIDISDDCIIDVETGEKIYEGYLENDFSDNYFPNTYFGGEYNIVLEDDRWNKVRYSNGDSDTQYEPLGMESGPGYYEYIAGLNETYYVFIDKYGIFLRTYEKGEAQEEVILMYR